MASLYTVFSQELGLRVLICGHLIEQIIYGFGWQAAVLRGDYLQARVCAEGSVGGDKNFTGTFSPARLNRIAAGERFTLRPQLNAPDEYMHGRCRKADVTSVERGLTGRGEQVDAQMDRYFWNRANFDEWKRTEDSVNCISSIYYFNRIIGKLIFSTKIPKQIL